jgi:hypothetical protein
VSAVVLTVGETMALLDPDHHGPPRCGARFTLRVAGAESNVAIGLARLGVEARWLSRLGEDELGAAVRAALDAEGVDLGWTVSDAQGPTGLFLKVRSDGRSSVVYYRSGSAASRLGPGDVPDEALEGVDLVHLTGITLALSAGCRELVLDLARARARARSARPVRPQLPRGAVGRAAGGARGPATAPRTDRLVSVRQRRGEPAVRWATTRICGGDVGRRDRAGRGQSRPARVTGDDHRRRG